MATASYTFKVTISGADAITQAKQVRTAIEAEFKGISIESLPQAQQALEQLRKTARGVGRALTAGFKAQVGKLLQQIDELQAEINQVVRAGADPIQEALKEMGLGGVEAMGLLDAGSKEATQSMAKLTTIIGGTRSEIAVLQKKLAQLGTTPIMPTGAPGQIQTLTNLFHDMTHTRIKDVRRLARASDEALAPMREEIGKQTAAVKAELTPAYERLQQELAELSAEAQTLITRQAAAGRFGEEWQQLEADITLYKQAIMETSHELGEMRARMGGADFADQQSKVNELERTHLAQLAEKTRWWKEITQGGGEYAAIIDYVAKTAGKDAAEALQEMVNAHQRIKKLSETEARTIGRMDKLKDKIELPPGAEGSLAMLVVAERALGTTAKAAGEQLAFQAKKLGILVRALDQATQAAEGFDRAQREAIKRVQMSAERQMRQATKLSLGLTPEQAGAAVLPILAQLDVQIETIKNQTLGQIDEIEQEGKRRKPFSWLIKTAQQVSQMLVGRSIIPDLVTAINAWLAKIGVEDPFTDLAADAENAAERIQTGLQERLKALTTKQAQQELKDLQEELKETSLAIEKQLVRTSEASKAYGLAFKAQAEEIARVSGEDPTIMAMLAEGKLPKGIGIKGEVHLWEKIDEGYQAIKTDVEERKRFSAEELEKLDALTTKHTALRLQALALERIQAEQQVASLELAMAAALDEQDDVDAFEKLNQEYIAAQERLGDIANDLAFERASITSEVAGELEQQAKEAKAKARRTIRTGAGVEVGGEIIMPRITKTQVKNAREYASAMEEVAEALKTVPTKEYQAALESLYKSLEKLTTLGPIVSEEEKKRLVATARAAAEAAEIERRRTLRFAAQVQTKTAAYQAALNMREDAVKKSADVVVEQAKRKTSREAQYERRLTATHKGEMDARVTVVKEGAREARQVSVEEEKRKTAELKAELARQRTDYEEKLRAQAQAERKARRAWMGAPTPPPGGVGGGRVGALAWAMRAAQRQQMGLRTLTYDLRHFGRTMMFASAALTGPPILAMRRYVEYTRETDRSARAMGLAREESQALRQELIDQSVAMGLVKPEEFASGLYLWVTGVGAAASSMEELRDIIEDTIPIQQMAYMQQISLAEGTEATAGILAEYRMETDQTSRVVEVLATTADRTFAAVGDLGEAFKFVGPIAHELGISVEETAATFGLLADANIRGSMAGRAMRQMLIRLSKTTKEQDKSLNELFNRSEGLGQTWRDLVFPEGKFIGLAKWVDLLAAALQDVTDEERAAALATIATANELPALTALVTRQVEAREHGVNVIRAETKVIDGILDEEVQAYADWHEATTGSIMSLESAHESHARKVKETTESEAYQIDQLQRRWEAAMLAMGKATMELAMPALEELAEIVGDLSEFITKNPWVAEAILAAGGVLAAVGILATTAQVVMRAITITKTIQTGLGAYVAALTAAGEMQLVAAQTNLTAAEANLTTAGAAAAAGGTLLAKLTKGVGLILALVTGFEVGRWVSAKVRGEDIGVRQVFEEIGVYTRQSIALTMATIMASLAKFHGEDVWGAFELTVELSAKLLGLWEDSTEEIAGWRYELMDASEEMKRLKDFERQAREEAAGLMQVPAAAGGLTLFTEAELEAIDELEDYLRRRNDMIQGHNEDLARMEQEFLAKEADYYQDYLDKRADLERELRELSSEPLWRASEDVRKSEQRIAKAIEEYNKRISKAIEDHQRKLRNLRESHDDKMEDLEARRDAKGIIAERRRYGRAVRDANEHKDDLLSSSRERLDETIKDEREKLAEARKERKADLEEKLRDLDENYVKESQKRKDAYEKAYQDRQQQQARDLQQLERAHAAKLAKILGWEERVRNALRKAYIDREKDLRAHLARMERAYLDAYNMISQLSPESMTPEEYRQWHERIRGHQAGGYASAGVYRLGEGGGREYVLSSSTTRALERSIGHLTQAKLAGMAGGGAGGRYWLNVHVTADEHFSPDFEVIVQQQIVNLSTKVTQSKPGAYRPH